MTATELAVSEETGVSRSVLRRLRAGMKEGEHFVRGDNGITYTEAGLVALEGVGVVMPRKKPTAGSSVVDGVEDGLAPETGVAQAVDGAMAKKTAVVTRTFVNLRILEAELESGNLVNVRVRDNRMFAKGMKIPVLMPDDGTKVWRLGCRQPRIRGRIAW